jgi:hypothetical protein
MGNMVSKRVLYQQFADDQGDNNLSNHASWMEADKANLEARQNAPIKMSNTTYGRFEAQQKRDAKRAYQKMCVSCSSSGQSRSFDILRTTESCTSYLPHLANLSAWEF